jgi:hypothetical protein
MAGLLMAADTEVPAPEGHGGSATVAGGAWQRGVGGQAPMTLPMGTTGGGVERLPSLSGGGQWGAPAPLDEAGEAIFSLPPLPVGPPLAMDMGVGVGMGLTVGDTAGGAASIAATATVGGAPVGAGDRLPGAWHSSTTW